MQEESHRSKEERRNIPWAIALGGLAVAIVVCLLVVAITIVTTDRPSMPTAAAQAVGEASSILKTDDTNTPVPELYATPLVPQPGGRSAGDPYIPELGNSGYDVQQYTILLALDPASDHVEGTTTIEAVSTLDGLSELSLDFAGFDVGSVTMDGRAAGFVREDKKIIVASHEPLPAGTPFSLVISYRGNPLYQPSPYTGFVDHLGLHYPDGNSIFAVAEPDGARYWFPANDHPRDKATYRFEILVPEGLVAVANGRLIDQRPAALPGGDLGNLFVWEHEFPMAPYLALVAVGPYERIDGQTAAGIPLRHYALPEQRQEILEVAAEAGAALDWMASLFGAYPFESFGYVTAQLPGASMESQTMVLLSDSLIGKKTAVHELAHMWFGNWVSLDSWAEMWRNEGFATYFQLMWENRDDPEELELRMASISSVVEGNDKYYPLNQPPPEYLFELNVYFKGAMAVHALRQEMGDQDFFSGLRTYFQTYGGGAASDGQFKAVMESAAGRSLDEWFAEWFPPA